MRALSLAAALACAALVAACSSANGYPSPDVTQDPEACASCHLSDYRGVRKPVHVGEKPTTCGICHTQTDWHPSVVHHPWPLTGAHASASSCFECHKGDPTVFRGTPKLCFGCHAADYQRGPDHVAEQFPTTCEECHSTTKWKPVLDGAHPPTPKIVPATSGTATAAATTSAATPTKKTTSPKTKTTPTTSPTTTSTAPDVTTGSSPRRH